VSQAAQDKLRALRQRLAELDPYPWEPVEVWIASARPLMKAQFGEHFDEFKAIAATPEWYSPVYVAAGGDRRWGSETDDNFADEDARKAREDRTRAAAAKAKILAFVDGLLDLPSSLDLAPTPAGATRPRSKDAGALSHDEILELRGAVISARLARRRDALLAHLPPEFTDSLPVAGIPGDQILMDLVALHAAGELIDGSLPLAIWLKNAAQLCGGQQEEKVFTEALERVRSGAARPPGSQVHSLTLGDQARAITIAHQHGLSFTDAERLFGSLFEQNLPKLAEHARIEAQRRVDEFSQTFRQVAAAQELTEAELSRLADPNAQYLVDVIAGSNSPELYQTLARLVVRRLQNPIADLRKILRGKKIDRTNQHVEGTWTSSPNGSTYCLRFVGDDLCCAYCHNDDDHLTGEVYNWTLHDGGWCAQFTWLDQPIRGYVHLRVVSRDEFAGGWWYERDVRPSQVPSLPNVGAMHRLRWKRTTSDSHPTWAEHYFESVGRVRPSAAPNTK
jgi:hypothetical protein